MLQENLLVIMDTVDANSSNVISDLGEIELDCSLPNTLTVNYSKNLEKPDYINGHIYDRYLYQMFLECKGQVRMSNHQTNVCQIILLFQQGGSPDVTCSIDLSHKSIGTDHSPYDVFYVGNLTMAGIQTGSSCTVEGCYEYIYEDYEEEFITDKILTPRDSCYIQGEYIILL